MSQSQLPFSPHEKSADVDTYFDYAAHLTESHEYDKAEAVYRRALEEYHNNAALLSSFAVFLEEVRGNNTEAELTYTQALDAAPHSCLHLDNYTGFVCEVLGDVEKADAAFQKAVEANPTNPNHLYGNSATTTAPNISTARPWTLPPTTVSIRKITRAF